VADAQVSVALCTCNGARYLAQQLDSLLAQDHPPFELVACDDASDDATWELLQAHAPRFAHARLIRNTNRLGVHANFQQALAACRGEWIAPCDQDDLWAPQKISRLLAQAGDALLVYCDSELVDAELRPLGERVSDRLPMISGGRPLAFAFGNCVSGHAALVRRSLLAQALPVPPGVFYDEWLAFVASSLGTIRYVDEPLVQFRQHDRNLTRFVGQGDASRKSPLALHRLQAPKLDALAGFPAPMQARLQTLAQLWHAREHQWVSPRLAGLMLRDHAELMLLEPRARRRPAWRQALKLFWGLRAKMLTWQARQNKPAR